MFRSRGHTPTRAPTMYQSVVRDMIRTFTGLSSPRSQWECVGVGGRPTAARLFLVRSPVVDANPPLSGVKAAPFRCRVSVSRVWVFGAAAKGRIPTSDGLGPPVYALSWAYMGVGSACSRRSVLTPGGCVYRFLERLFGWYVAITTRK